MRSSVLLVALFLWTGAGTDLLACGNKFLVPSRGTRFGKVPIDRQAAHVLVYSPPNSALAQALKDTTVAALLTKVGYQPTEVTGPADLDAALRRGGWDLVLADLADTATLRGQLQGSGAPAILPVVLQPSRSQLAEAKETYGQVIQLPAKSQRFVETVDYAVATHVEQRTTASR